MPNKTKAEPVGRGRESSPVSLLAEWVRQGTESFFATQRILLDLVMKQNSNTFSAVRERLAGARTAPVEALTEIAGEGISNFIAAQRVILQLAQRQNDIILGGVKERTSPAALTAMTDVLRRGVDTFLEMQQHFLTIASKQADMWVESAKEGAPPDGYRIGEAAREAMETFVRSQKKFLDAIAEETAHATGAKNGRDRSAHRKTDFAELAREGAEAFIDAQKKLLDIAAQQVSASVSTARKTVQAINPLPPVALADLTRNTVDSFVAAQKALLDTMAKRGAPKAERHETPRKKPPARKRAVREAEEVAAV